MRTDDITINIKIKLHQNVMWHECTTQTLHITLESSCKEMEWLSWQKSHASCEGEGDVCKCLFSLPWIGASTRWMLGMGCEASSSGTQKTFHTRTPRSKQPLGAWCQLDFMHLSFRFRQKYSLTTWCVGCSTGSCLILLNCRSSTAYWDMDMAACFSCL